MSRETTRRPEEGDSRPDRFRKIWSPAFLISCLLVAAASSVAASSFFPEFYHLWTPKIGEWSSYRILDARGETADLTFSIVSKEGDLFWLEVKTKQEGAEGIAAFLLSGDPSEDANVQGVRAQEAGQPALEIDRATLDKLKTQGQAAFGGEATAIGPRVGKLEPLAEETVTAGGKKLKCRHIRITGPDQTAEIWLNESVTPFGLVKLKSGMEEVTLTDFGKGAKPSIKGPFTRMSVP